MKFEVEYITNLGLERKQNEDSILIGNKIVSSISMRELERTVLNDEILLFAIADGMGGLNKGEVASFFVLHFPHKIPITILQTSKLQFTYQI